MINFYAEEGVAEPRLRRDIVRAWLNSVATQHGRRVGTLSYMFCNDEQILKANRDFLQHDYYTDIITFDSSEGERIAGDLLISLDTVRSNADGLGISYEEELHRVMVHGVLHLCGYGDKSEDEALRMRQLEDEALSLLYPLLDGKPLMK